MTQDFAVRRLRGRFRRLALVLGVLAAGTFAQPALADDVLISSCPQQPHPSVAACNLTFSGTQALGTLQATATFTIAAGFTNVQISLASYSKPGPAFATTFPQQLFASATGFFSAGTHTLRVGVPAPCGFFQVDLIRGAPLQTLQTVTYGPQGRLLAAALGGNGSCGAHRTIGFWKNHASCSGSNGNQAFVLDQTLAAAGGTIQIGDLAVDTCLEAVRILDKSSVSTGAKMASNAAYNLAAQLLGAKLNLQAGAVTCPGATATVASAQALLDTINFTGSGTPTMTADQRSLANALAAKLDAYNNGQLSQVC